MSDPEPPAPRGFLNWWQGLILAASSALIGVVAAVSVMRPGSGVGNAPGPAMVLLRFVPHFLLLFGVLADAFTYEGVYWTGTMAGLLSIPGAMLLDKASAALLGLFVTATSPDAKPQGGGGDDGYPGCNMMDMGGQDGDGVPQTLTVSASILFYYIFDLITNLSVLDAAGAIVAALFLFGGQAAAISSCVKDGKIFQVAAFAGIYGMIIGGVFFSIMNTWGPSYLPSTVLAGSKTAGDNPGGAGRKGLGTS